MKKNLLAALLFAATIILQAKSNGDLAFSQNHTPLSFIENKGQVTDQNLQVRNDIQFRLAASPGLNIFIGNGAIRYQFSRMTGAKANGFDCNMWRMDVELIGANKNARAITSEKCDYFESHSISGVSATAHCYNRITYKNIYPHIDWVLYIGSGQLEHEFVVNPGGKVSDIQLKYGGTDNLTINADGSLTAQTPQGVIIERAPKSFQHDGKPVASSFRLHGNTLSFETGKHKGALVIDPTLIWATFYGGNNTDVATAVATKGTGTIYVTGFTYSTSAIATSGAYQTTLGGNYDAFLARFNSTGQLQWATYYGGTENDQAYGIAADDSGYVYIAGTTASTSAIATANAYQTSLDGGGDAFLAKFNNAGNIEWATYYGGSNYDFGNGVSVDFAGNVYLVGNTRSTDGIATSGAYQTSAGGGSDAFVVKFNSQGARQWGSYFGGPGADDGNGVSADSLGNVYVTGAATSQNLASNGAYQTTNGGGTDDAFLANFNTTGGLQWATYFGGSGYDLGQGVAADYSGNVYIAGYTSSTSDVASSGAYQTSMAGINDAFIAKFSSTGSALWATYYGGTGADLCTAVTADRAGNVYITGNTTSTSGIATNDASQTVFGGSSDVFYAQFSSTGSQVWATYLGGSGGDGGNGVSVDRSGNVYVAGYTHSATGLASGAVYQTTIGDTAFGDGFLAKFGVPGTGIENVTATYEASLFPNPNNGDFILQFSDNETREVEITDALGRVVMPFTKVEHQHQFSFDALSAGIYIMQIHQNNEVKSLKFSVVK